MHTVEVKMIQKYEETKCGLVLGSNCGFILGLYQKVNDGPEGAKLRIYWCRMMSL